MYDANYKPIGLCVVTGETVKGVAKIGTAGDFNLKFGIQPTNGIFVNDKSLKASVIPSIQYDNSRSSVLYATQSGPLMLLNGERNSNFTQGSNNLNIRNGVGIDNQGNVVLIMSNTLINFTILPVSFETVFIVKMHYILMASFLKPIVLLKAITWTALPLA